MFDLDSLKKEFGACGCGRSHTIGIKSIETGSGITCGVGRLMLKCGFKKNLLLVADKNTLKAADGILESLGGFLVTVKLYDDLRVADMNEVRVLESLLEDNDGVLSVGTGSLHDIARLAAAHKNKPLALYATAASMDGFASYCAPITENGFKLTYPAKSPELIIADTKVLSRAPAELKSAGFGDMVAKYTALIDWQIAHLIAGEYYCEKVAALTRLAADRIFSLSREITSNSERSAGAVFEALLLTGIGMSFTENSRPASGAEHVLSHFWECKKLLDGKLSDFHGKKVGVATLLVMREYEKLLRKDAITARREKTDWERVYRVYGPLSNDVRKLNSPTVTENIDPKTLEQNFPAIKKIVESVPSAAEIERAMINAGCALSPDDISVSPELAREGLLYHAYMRHRITLMRLMPMLEL